MTFSELAPGKKIRFLRQERNLSIEALSLQADITAPALSGIERKSVRPQRENLLKILEALEAVAPVAVNYRSEVIEAFGYLDAPGLPTPADIQLAIDTWQKPFKEAPLPGYLVDLGQRFHDWNGPALQLLGSTREEVRGTTVFDLLFSPHTTRNMTMVNREEVIERTVTHMWYEYQPFLEQEWCRRTLEAAYIRYPAFKEMFLSLRGTTHPSVNLRVIEPVILAGPGRRRFNFCIVGTDLVHDPRFRVVQYVPADRDTLEEMIQLLGKA